MLIDFLWLIVLITAVPIAGIVERQFALWTIPRSRLWSWLMWSALAGSAISFTAMQQDLSAEAALAWSLLLAPLCQPVLHTLLWLGAQPGVRRALNRDRKQRAYLQIGFWTIRLTREPEPPDPPPEPPGPPGPAWPATTAKVMAGVAMLTWPLVMLTTEHMREPGRVVAVRGALDAEGHTHARLRRVQTGGACWGG